MSEFIFIIPEGWTQVPAEVIDLVGASLITLWIGLPDMASLNEALHGAGFIPNGLNCTNAVYFNGEVLAIVIE